MLSLPVRLKFNAEVLPSRIREKIEHHESRSEQIIAWVQVCVAATFAVLYAISPKTFPADVEFTPVPWVLLAFSIFAVIHLIYSYKTLPPDWFTYFSILVDISLIYSLIWSFHLQYMQPPAFYLKAPTLLYVFIFIGMRTLRFEVRFILFAGFAAASGWLLMVLYVLMNNPGEDMITRDYIHYLTSNTMLIGAEFDKIITILIVSLVLAVAVYRARTLLVESVVEANVAEDLAHFVPNEVVRDLKSAHEAPEAGKAQSYDAAIMFTDIVSFTSISEKLPAEEMVTTLNQYFSALEEVLDSFSGTINQFQGDAILASFDKPRDGLTPSECAVSAALAINRMLESREFGRKENPVSLRNRIGINTGEVVGGFMGSKNRLIYTVHGDVVNLAARLEQLNKEYDSSVMISEATLSTCRKGLFEVLRSGETVVKGRVSSTRVFAIAPLESS